MKRQWRSLYRMVAESDQTLNVLLTEQCDQQAAIRFVTKTIRRHGVPEVITIDGSEASTAAIIRCRA